MGLSLRVRQLRIIEVWSNEHDSRSASSQLANEDAPPKRLVQQCHGPTGTRESGTLFQPGLGGGFHDIWLDVFAQAGAHLGQSLLRGLVLAVDELNGELCQHFGMVAKDAISTEVGRAAVQ